MQFRCEIRIAVAGDGEVLGNLPAAAMTLLHGADGERVAREKDGIDRRIAILESAHGFGAAARCDGHLDLQALGCLDTLISERGAVSDLALLQTIVAVRGSRDKANALVADVNQPGSHPVSRVEVGNANQQVNRFASTSLTDLHDRDSARSQLCPRGLALHESLQDETRGPPTYERTDRLF